MTSQRPLRIGLLLPTRGLLLQDEGTTSRQELGAPSAGTELLFSMARRAEEAGLDSIWVGDSLLAKPRLEPMSTLAALATHTQQVELGTAVLLAPLRQPAQLAQMAATVDILSGGRLVLGVGVGGVFTQAQRREWLAAGVSPEERGRRMTELMRACRLLWSQERVSFKGRFYNLEEASLGLTPVPSELANRRDGGGVPMLLACHYRTGLESQYRRAARYADGVIGISDTPGQFAQVLERVRTLAEAEGRDPDSLRSAFYMTVNIDEDNDKAFREADEFIRSYYGQNFWADKWGPFGPAQAVAARILEYAEAGAEEIVIRFASIHHQQRQLETFVEQVLPSVKSANVPKGH